MHPLLHLGGAGAGRPNSRPTVTLLVLLTHQDASYTEAVYQACVQTEANHPPSADSSINLKAQHAGPPIITSPVCAWVSF